MAYTYYVVAYTKTSGEVISTYVYESDEASARSIGASLLKSFYGISIPEAALDVYIEESLTSDTITTT